MIWQQKPSLKQKRYRTYWVVAIYLRGRREYIGCAKSWDEAVEIERQAKRNFPKQLYRKSSRGFSRETMR